MAKDSDKTTGTFGAEKAGGKLSGLLADEKEFDRRTLWRIGGWGAAAVATLIVAVLANQGAQSWRRDRASAADLARQTQLLQSLARDNQNESRQLAAAIETLNNDRDRLYARITVLEQSLDSVTGALSRPGAPQASSGAQSSGNRQPLTAASPSPAAPPTQIATVDAQQPQTTDAPSSASGSQAAASGSAAPDPTVGAPAMEPITTSAAAGDKIRADGARPGGAPVAALQPQPSAAAMAAMAAAPAASNSLAGPSTASLVAPKSIMAPPDPAAAKPADPGRTDSRSDSKPQVAPADASAKAVNAAPDTVHRTEFALDLGSANSINGLRALWRGLVKSNSELATLRPIIMVKEGNTGLGMQLRLGAGPLSDAAAAAKICARLSESQRPCETTVYDGQRLATRDEDNEVGPDGARQNGAVGQKAAPGTPGAPTYQRRRASQQRHGASREPQAAQPAPPPPQQQPEPKPAEPATLSALFRRSQ